MPRELGLIESCDTNILFHAINTSSPHHGRAASYLESHREDSDFALCELVLVELYVLVRNPTVNPTPLGPLEAARLVQSLRQDAGWAIVDYPGGLMSRVWQAASMENFARRKIFDVRLALTLQHYGVRRFATRNTKDFESLGFEQIFDPLAGAGAQAAP
jgi:hypothetical protein